eukprot:2042942-Pyramimonas_sp.AAC.1
MREEMPAWPSTRSARAMGLNAGTDWADWSGTRKASWLSLTTNALYSASACTKDSRFHVACLIAQPSPAEGEARGRDRPRSSSPSAWPCHERH